MGERTQIYINVKDEKGRTLAGTIVHHQWGGFSRTMMMDALGIATQMPQLFCDLNNSQGIKKYPHIAHALKKDGGAVNVDFAINFYQWLEHHLSYEGEINDPTPLEKTDKNIAKTEPGSGEYYNAAGDAYYDLLCNEDEFEKQCDNNDGYMIIEIVYKTDAKDFMDNRLQSIKFGFADQYKNAMSFLKFVSWYRSGQPAMNKDFVAGYLEIMKGFGIGEIKPEVLNKEIATPEYEL